MREEEAVSGDGSLLVGRGEARLNVKPLLVVAEKLLGDGVVRKRFDLLLEDVSGRSCRRIRGSVRFRKRTAEAQALPWR